MLGSVQSFTLLRQKYTFIRFVKFYSEFFFCNFTPLEDLSQLRKLLQQHLKMTGFDRISMAMSALVFVI